MIDPEALIATARRLLTKPEQQAAPSPEDLRRAVSTAYYALARAIAITCADIINNQLPVTLKQRLIGCLLKLNVNTPWRLPQSSQRSQEDHTGQAQRRPAAAQVAFWHNPTKQVTSDQHRTAQVLAELPRSFGSPPG